MPPRSPQPKKNSKATTKLAVNKSRSGGVNAKAKKVKVKGDIVGRDKIMKAGRDLIVNVGAGQSASNTPVRPLKKLWHTYCDALIQQHRYLNLQGVGADPNLRVELEAVYVSLRTNEQRARDEANKTAALIREERESLTVIEVAAQKNQLVIVGDPGSGKSTFLSHLAVPFAEAWNTVLFKVEK